MPFPPWVARRGTRRSPTAALSLAAAFSLAALALAAILLVSPSPATAALPGGVSASAGLEAEIPGTGAETPGEVGGDEVGAARARLLRGRAITPAGAPAAVRRVIAAANRIRTLPYIWGGGHRSWRSRGYDCSGAVSYALHGGKLLSSPLTSGSLERFGEAGPGRWITVYANASHAYMVVAGLRFDTAGDTRGSGPRWHPSVAAAASGRFVVRHPAGY